MGFPWAVLGPGHRCKGVGAPTPLASVRVRASHGIHTAHLCYPALLSSAILESDGARLFLLEALGGAHFLPFWVLEVPCPSRPWPLPVSLLRLPRHHISSDSDAPARAYKTTL